MRALHLDESDPVAALTDEVLRLADALGPGNGRALRSGVEACGPEHVGLLRLSYPGLSALYDDDRLFRYAALLDLYRGALVTHLRGVEERISMFASSACGRAR